MNEKKEKDRLAENGLILCLILFLNVELRAFSFKRALVRRASPAEQIAHRTQEDGL